MEAKIMHFLKSWGGGIAIGITIAIAVENRSGGGGGQLTQLYLKVPLLGELVTGKKV